VSRVNSRRSTFGMSPQPRLKTKREQQMNKTG